MRIADLPFGTVDWNAVESTTHPGASGAARWRTRQFGDVRVRMLDYSPGYVADHWCTKGHFLLCLAGELDDRARRRPPVHADARHELPGGGRRGAASFFHAHRSDAVRRRLMDAYEISTDPARLDVARDARLPHAFVLVAGHPVRDRRTRRAQLAVLRSL